MKNYFVTLLLKDQTITSGVFEGESSAEAIEDAKVNAHRPGIKIIGVSAEPCLDYIADVYESLSAVSR